MTRLDYGLPAYEKAIESLARSVLDGLLESDELISGIAKRSTIHAGPTRNIGLQGPVDRPLKQFEQLVMFPMDVIRDSDIDEYLSVICKMADEFKTDMQTELFETLSTITESVGNVVSAGGMPLSYDLVLDAFDKLELGFDEYGNVQMPTLVVNPLTAQQLRNIVVTPEHHQRFQEMIERKRAEVSAKKRTRRLS